MTIGALHLDTPALFVLGVLAPFVVFAAHLYDQRRQRVLMERLGELPAVQRMMAARSPGRRTAKAILAGLAVGLVLVGASRPWISRVATTRKKGIDLIVALDVSKSMLVGDVQVGQPKGGWPEDMKEDEPRPVPDDPEWVQGTRLERGRQVVDAVLDKLADDRIGVVMFAGASIHFPLTDDPKLAVQLAHQIGPMDLMGGSDIAEAVRVSKCLLRSDLDDPAIGCYGIGRRGTGGADLSGATPKPAESADRGKAILVVTDGGSPTEDVAKEIDAARQLGISIYLVGVGSDRGGVVPELDNDGNVVGSKKDASGNPVRVKLERASLQALAKLAGGDDHYVEVGAQGPFDVTSILTALAQVPRGEAERTDADRPHDLYHWFLFPGLVLLVIEAVIGLRRRVPHPEVIP